MIWKLARGFGKEDRIWKLAWYSIGKLAWLRIVLAFFFGSRPYQGLGRWPESGLKSWPDKGFESWPDILFGSWNDKRFGSKPGTGLEPGLTYDLKAWLALDLHELDIDGQLIIISRFNESWLDKGFGSWPDQGFWSWPGIELGSQPDIGLESWSDKGIRSWSDKGQSWSNILLGS